jgi:hypothetical protein
MSDKVTVTDAAVEIVRAAMAATPPNADEFAYRQAVRGRIPVIAHLLSPGSTEAVFAQKLLECKYIIGTLLSVELEESTKRWIVTIRGSTRSDGTDPDEETETFRTDHSESFYGKQMYEKLMRYIGVECRFAIWLEPVTGSKKKAVRQLQDFTPFGKPQSGQAARNETPRTMTVPEHSKAIVEALSDPNKVVYMREIERRLGVKNPLNVGDKLEQCKKIARAIVDGTEIPYRTEDA